MISCKECKERLYPEDPTIRVGKYHLSTCEHYCDKPSYYRELEERLSTEVIIKKVHTHINIDKKALELQKRIVSLESKLEHLDKKKRTDTYTIK